MAGVYMIGIRWSQPAKTTQIEQALASVGNWLRLDSGVWFVRTDKNAADVYSVLASVLSKNDYEVITRIDPLDYSGWAADWINDWLAGRPFKVPKDI